jgi:uroporphyrinogen decarboxylase
VSILNPVQVKAQGMDLPKLKKEFGKNIVFWGGVDTQQALPFGKPAEVRDEVRRCIDELAPGGGYILAAVHNLQADVPPQNIIAMFEEALRYGVY